ncbi:MAG: hypothetical protein AB1598_00150 [Thermodesulfobacteriota bacterium]
MRIKSCICYIPVILLISVALIQILLAHAYGLAPWSGGGFGMFSTQDAAQSRHIHAYALSPGVRRELVIPERLRERALKVAAFPSDSRLKGLALELAEIPTPDSGPLESIVIQVWKTDYDKSTLSPSGEIVKSLEVRFDGR